MVGDAFRIWTSSPDWSPKNFEPELTISKLYSIQTEFYHFFIKSLSEHVISFILLTLIFVGFYKIKFPAFARAYVLGISVQMIFIPLLIWTQNDSFFGPFIFTKLITISFFASQLNLISNKKLSSQYSAVIFLFTSILSGYIGNELNL